MTAPSILPIAPIEGPAAFGSATPAFAGPVSGPGAFGNLLTQGLGHVEQKVADAEHLATDFALNDSVPLHQVTFALQQARLSLEFMLQVRSRLVEAYQQFAGMQL